MATARQRFVADLHGIRGDLARATEELAEEDVDLWHVMTELYDVHERVGAIHAQLSMLSVQALEKALDTETS